MSFKKFPKLERLTTILLVVFIAAGAFTILQGLRSTDRLAAIQRQQRQEQLASDLRTQSTVLQVEQFIAMALQQHAVQSDANQKKLLEEIKILLSRSNSFTVTQNKKGEITIVQQPRQPSPSPTASPSPSSSPRPSASPTPGKNCDKKKEFSATVLSTKITLILCMD